LYRLLYLQLGGSWRIRLLLGPIWKGVGCWWKVLCVVCVGRRKSLTAICFSLAVLLGGFGVFALSGWECRLCLTLILRQTLSVQVEHVF